jgi:tRNA(fMet)-specific endonuclease VapC
MKDWRTQLPYGVPVLLDTVTILQIIRKNEIGTIIDWTFHISEHWEDFFITAMTVAELLALTQRNNWSARKRRLLEQVFQQIQILDYLDRPIIDAYAELSIIALQKGRGVGQNDLWIAAFAKTYDMVLLTMDNDFNVFESELYELRVINY